MKGNKLNEMSNEKLLKTAKTVKIMTYMLAGMLLVLFIVNIFVISKNGFNTLVVVPIALLPIALLPIALLPILFLNFNSLKEMKKEIKSRNL